jgi:hypothetical protein
MHIKFYNLFIEVHKDVIHIKKAFTGRYSKTP